VNELFRENFQHSDAPLSLIAARPAARKMRKLRRYNEEEKKKKRKIKTPSGDARGARRTFTRFIIPIGCEIKTSFSDNSRLLCNGAGTSGRGGGRGVERSPTVTKGSLNGGVQFHKTKKKKKKKKKKRRKKKEKKEKKGNEEGERGKGKRRK